MFAIWRVRHLGYRPDEVGLSPVDERRVYDLEQLRPKYELSSLPKQTMPVIVVSSVRE